jgi:anti-anti-sigma factor
MADDAHGWDEVIFRATREGASEVLRLSRASAEDRRASLEPEGWTVEIEPVATIEPPPTAPPAEGTVSSFRAHRGADGVLYLTGELDLASVEAFRTAVGDPEDSYGDVVLEVADLSFVDSVGISAIVTLAKRLLPRCLVLRHPQSHVATVLEILDVGAFGIRVEASTPDS